MHYSVNKKRSDIAINGVCKVVVFADEYFGGEDSQTYWSRKLYNPTWDTLYKCAKRSVNKTKDIHHMFFENVHYKSTIDGVHIYEIFLGS